MSLLDQLNSDLLTATKGNDPLTRDTLRMVKTAIKNMEINNGKPLSDEEVVSVLSKEVKQRQESITSFVSGGRPELADKEEQEIAILKKYLPEQLSEAEITAIIDQAITETGANSASDMGKVMAVIMPKTKGRADGSLVSRLVRERLG